MAEKVKVEAEEAGSRSVEVLKKEVASTMVTYLSPLYSYQVLKKEVAKLKITAERHETQQHEHVESFKAEKVS